LTRSRSSSHPRTLRRFPASHFRRSRRCCPLPRCLRVRGQSIARPRLANHRLLSHYHRQRPRTSCLWPWRRCPRHRRLPPSHVRLSRSLSRCLPSLEHRCQWPACRADSLPRSDPVPRNSGRWPSRFRRYLVRSSSRSRASWLHWRSRCRRRRCNSPPRVVQSHSALPAATSPQQQR
jgi:hypothetical protein